MPRRHTTNLYYRCRYRRLLTWPSAKLPGVVLYAYMLRPNLLRRLLSLVEPSEKAQPTVAPPTAIPIRAAFPQRLVLRVLRGLTDAT
jgi:hypothetical protein